MPAHDSTNSPAAPRAALPRRLVLAAALVLGVVTGLPRATEPAHAAPVLILAQVADDKAAAPPATAIDKAPAAKAPAARPTGQQAARKAAAAAAEPTTEADPAAADAAEASAPSEVTIDNRGVTIRKSGGRRVKVQGLGQDREFDSFEEFVHQAPWLAGLVFLTVILLFVVPLLIVVLLIWYKIRKTRMQNETMLKLAERGVVPPAEAMEVLSPRAPADVPPSAVPLYEQARQVRRRAAWSDLRKGVVLVAIGLAFIFYSMFDDGSPNWVGLICLFLGLGYGVLWFFEDRAVEPARGAGPPPAGSA